MVDWLGEQVALRSLATQILEEIQLSLCFHAFGYHFQAKIVRQHDDNANDLVGLRVTVHARDESAIDLQSVNWEALQATERRVSGSEVVDVHADPKGF